MREHADALRSLISGRVLLDEPMSAHTTLGVGGPALCCGNGGLRRAREISNE